MQQYAVSILFYCNITLHVSGAVRTLHQEYIKLHRKSILINVKRDATICSLYFILLQYHSTCFGCRPHPSSGVHKAVVTATGTSHIFVQLPHSNVAIGHCWEPPKLILL